MTPSIQFLGAAGTVTGWRFLVHTPLGSSLVDTGLFRGRTQARLDGSEELPLP